MTMRAPVFGAIAREPRHRSCRLSMPRVRDAAAGRPGRRRRHVRPHRSISPAPGSPSSPRTGAGAWSTPPKGDVASVPVSAEGRKVAQGWDLAADNASGNQCKAFGVGGIMRQPGRLRISWQDDETLKLEFDAGTQTRRAELRSRETGAGGEELAGILTCAVGRSGCRSRRSGDRRACDGRRHPVARRPRRRWSGSSRRPAAAAAERDQQRRQPQRS